MREPSSSPVPPRKFATTRWSLVLAAGQSEAPEAGEAFAELCALYWYPIYAFVRRQGHSAEEAKDLTQGFFARLTEKNDLAVAEPSRGRFRAWLLASVKHYLANAWDRERAQKRGGHMVRLDVEDAELHFCREPARGLTPERAYDRSCVLALLERVLNALGEQYARDGKEALFARLKGTLTGEEGSYPEIAQALGMTAPAVKVAAFRLRQRFRELLHEEISHTVERPEDIGDELRFLLSALEDG